MHPDKPHPEPVRPDLSSLNEQQAMLYRQLWDLEQELRERLVLLTNSGCTGGTTEVEVHDNWAMLDQIEFASWLRQGHCKFPLKIIAEENRYAYFAWSQVIDILPQDTPVSTVADRLFTPVTFRAKTVPLAEVAHQGFLGFQDAARFIRNRIQSDR